MEEDLSGLLNLLFSMDGVTKEVTIAATTIAKETTPKAGRRSLLFGD